MLFEYFMNGDVYKEAAGMWPDDPDPVMQLEYMARAYAACGYDYVNTSMAATFAFPQEKPNVRIPFP